tara:strand:+ start:313 stop:690 length:378 start_codon:yes stop_codon:yes gene_type:complete
MTTQDTIPSTWQGSEASYLVHQTLVGLGKEPGRDFRYQPRTDGRRLGMGSEVEFWFTNPPNLAIQVEESFYTHHSGVETRGTDLMAKAQLAGQGVTLIKLDNDRLQQDPDWLIREALQYRDHSQE